MTKNEKIIIWLTVTGFLAGLGLEDIRQGKKRDQMRTQRNTAL